MSWSYSVIGRFNNKIKKKCYKNHKDKYSKITHKYMKQNNTKITSEKTHKGKKCETHSTGISAEQMKSTKNRVEQVTSI